jgi:hypothetical protein
VVGDPLQHGIRDDHVHAAVGLVVPDVTLNEAEPLVAAGRQLPCGLDHLGRAIDPADRGSRPPAGQRERQRAGAAAEVDDRIGALRAHPGEQIEERPRSLITVALVLVRIPHAASAGILTSSYIYLTNHSSR